MLDKLSPVPLIYPPKICFATAHAAPQPILGTLRATPPLQEVPQLPHGLNKFLTWDPFREQTPGGPLYIPSFEDSKHDWAGTMSCWREFPKLQQQGLIVTHSVELSSSHDEDDEEDEPTNSSSSSSDDPPDDGRPLKKPVRRRIASPTKSSGTASANCRNMAAAMAVPTITIPTPWRIPAASRAGDALMNRRPRRSRPAATAKRMKTLWITSCGQAVCAPRR